MKWAVIAIRTLLGLVFLVFGLNFFFGFIAMEPKLSEDSGKFMSAVYPTGYLKAVKVLEVVGGFLLVSGFLVPLGLTLLTPIIVNILFYEIFLQHEPGIGVAMTAMSLFLIYGYWPYFKAVFTIHSRPLGA